MPIQTTLTLRLRDRCHKTLAAMARQVDWLFNDCNEKQLQSVKYYAKRPKKWLSGFDFNNLNSGLSKCDGVLLDSRTIQAVCEEYATRVKQFKKAKLKWRVSDQTRSNRSLPWVPFKKGQVKWVNGQLRLGKHHFGMWDSYGLANYTLKGGSFTQDARGRWYVHVNVELAAPDEFVGPQMPGPTASVGIDLGLKECAVASNGARLEGRWFRAHEAELANAQRAKKKNRVRAIHAKIRNKRKDDQHKFANQLVNNHSAVFVGDVASAKLVKTRMAKSTLDAGWGQLKTMLEYKCHKAGVVFAVVDEKYTTQMCSSCGTIPMSSPKGRAGLATREWTCSNCGAHHDRDINAATNILQVGHGLPQGNPRA